LVRLWNLVQALTGTQRGRTVTQLASAVGASRATIFRDISLLEEAQVPIAIDRINGEARYRIIGEAIPALQPSGKQLAALSLLRTLAEPLRGTAIVRELDDFLEPLRRQVRPEGIGGVRIPGVGLAVPVAPVAFVRAIDHAIEGGTTVELVYRGAKDEAPSMRRVDPVEWRLCGEQLYLIAFDHQRNGWRTFKACRIGGVQMLLDKALRREFDEEALFGRSIRIWSGPAVDVAVRLSATVARFAWEWPICAEQTVEDDEGGAVVVRAKVAGTVEATRWVLRWGGEAEALEPEELRQAVQSELQRAIARYAPARNGPIGTLRKAGRARADASAVGGRGKRAARRWKSEPGRTTCLTYGGRYVVQSWGRTGWTRKRTG